MSHLWVKNSLAWLITSGLTAAVGAAPVPAPWAPAVESAEWRERRHRELPGSDWRFVEATRTEQLQAAEYLRHPKAVADTVELEAGLLLRRSGQTDWTSRVLPMRAMCSEGRMERMGADGQWTPYPGRPGTAVKVRWICSLP